MVGGIGTRSAGRCSSTSRGARGKPDICRAGGLPGGSVRMAGGSLNLDAHAPVERHGLPLRRPEAQMAVARREVQVLHHPRLHLIAAAPTLVHERLPAVVEDDLAR